MSDHIRILDEQADGWEIDADMAKMLEEGEESGLSEKSLEEIFAKARAQYHAR